MRRWRRTATGPRRKPPSKEAARPDVERLEAKEESVSFCLSCFGPSEEDEKKEGERGISSIGEETREKEGIPRAGPQPPALKIFFLLLLTTAGLLRLIHVFSVYDAVILEPRGFLDDAFYHQLALQVAAGDLAAGREPFFLAPLYIYFLALCYVLFSPSQLAPFLVQWIVSLGAILLVYRTAQRAWGETAGAVAALLFAFDGLAAMYSSTLLPASLDPFLCALFFFFVLRSSRRVSLASWLAAGAAAGLLSLNRPNTIIFIPATAVVPLLLRQPQGMIKAGGVMTAAALIIAPVTLRNWVVSRELVLISTHGGMNFYIGNAPGAEGFYRSVLGLSGDVRGQAEEAQRWFEERLQRRVKSAEVSGLFWREGWREIRAEPGQWLRLMGRKSRCLLAGREAGLNLSLGYMREAFSPVLYFLPVGMWLLIPLGITGAFIGRRSQEGKITAAFTLLAGAAIVIFFISDRYRLVLHIPLALLSSAAVAYFLLPSSCRRRRQEGTAVWVFLVFLYLALSDPGIPTGDGQMRLLHILRLIEEGQISEAQEIARRMPPGAMNPFYWRMKAARAYEAAGAYEAAAGEYEVLLQLAPDYGPTRCGYAGVLERIGRREEAREELARGLELSPQEALCREIEQRLRP